VALIDRWGAIDETAGEIAGLLADGQPFRFAFTRAAGASIVLVPEASVGALALVGGRGGGGDASPFARSWPTSMNMRAAATRNL
jgi:hypothetical protein